MAVKMNLWSLTLLPGEPVSMLVPRDFVLTQAALGEDLKSADGRSVIKVTHQPIPPHWFDSDDEDSDEELDSELEEELEDEFELSEEDDEEKEEEKPKAKVNGKKAAEAAEEDDEEEDEDEDDEDEDSDFSDDDELAETNVICSLLAGRVEQASVNLTFTEGEAVMFEVTGENAVHLMGNYINQMPSYADSDSEDDSDFDSEDYDDYSELYGDEEDSEDDAAATIEELDEKPAPAAPKKEKKAVAAAPAAAPKAEKPVKAESKPTPAAAAPKRKAEEIAADTSMTSTDGLSKNQKKKLAKKAKLEADGGKPAPAAAAAAAEKSSKRTLPSGLVIEDVKLGEGPGAKTGKKLGMRYIGKLENGKQFDANTAGAPFKFVLGRGEVIRGWDEGLVGMAVGGERRLTIPAQLAYGNQKIPGIPKGSTLKFDVKLVSIN